MKKVIALLLTVIMMVVCVLPVAAAPNTDKTGAELGPNPDSVNLDASKINFLTSENFANTEGYTDYSIFKNENVRFLYLDGDEEKECKYNFENFDQIGHAQMLGDCKSVFQIFRWSGTFNNPWYYNGAVVSMLPNTGIIEIKFHGTAINLINCYRSNPTVSINIGAKVSLDGGEYVEVDKAQFITLENTFEERSTFLRFYKVENLEDGWHTVRLIGTGTERFNIDAYEIKETTPAGSDNTQGGSTVEPSPDNGDLFIGLVTVALVAGTTTAVVIKKRKSYN